jgi:hypothetical protein
MSKFNQKPKEERMNPLLVTVQAIALKYGLDLVQSENLAKDVQMHFEILSKSEIIAKILKMTEEEFDKEAKHRGYKKDDECLA